MSEVRQPFSATMEARARSRVRRRVVVVEVRGS